MYLCTKPRGRRTGGVCVRGRVWCDNDLFLQEVSDSCPLFSRYGRQHLVGGLKVTPHHRCLVLEDGQQQRVADDGEFLVTEVDTVVLRNVAQ